MSAPEQTTALGAYIPAPPSESSDAAAPQAFDLVQDRLQNRWRWVGICGLVLGPIFALVAYFVAPVKWAAVGYVQVDSSLKPLVDQTMETARLDDFSAFVASRATLVRSDRVLESVLRAIRSGKAPASASESPGRDPEAELRILQQGFADSTDDAALLALIRDGLDASVPRGSSFIEVRYESKRPRVAAPLVNLVLDSFMEIYGPDAETEHTAQKAKIRGIATQSRLRLESFEEERSAVVRDAGFVSPDLDAAAQSLQSRILAQDARLDAIRSLEKKIERQHRERAGDAEAAVPATAMLEPTTLELEQLDPRLADIRRQIEDQRVLLSLALKKYKPEHPALQRISVELEGKEGLMNAARESALKTWREGVGSAQGYGALGREREEILAERALASEGLARISQVQTRLLKIDRDIAAEQGEIGRLAERLRELDREADSIRRGRVVIAEAASDRGVPESDRRVPLAVIGFLGGFAASFAAFFVLGTFDPRAYRVSQLRRDPRIGRWLGVVPDMSGAQSDPAARELASNCVHRVRNKIEARRQPGDGYAIMVTSPFQGDGKTTVAVALAWSYAESGHRTLLVDCDFIGRALSHQFGKIRAPGVCEALRRGGVADEIVEVGANLSLLPVGADAAFSASNLQIGALRRLMRGLRDRFEVIIVDSGPVTASVEAIPVASSCDGAVLAIRRGRSRTRLPEAIRELTDTGVEYLGVVLNYADADDCRRYGSISKMSAEVARALAGEGSGATPHPLLTDRGGG